MAALTAPGLWLQRVTTQPPSDEQASVAIHALGRRDAARRSARRRVGDRLNAIRSRWSPPCNIRKKSTKSKPGFDGLTRQMADPAVISDGETYSQKSPRSAPSSKTPSPSIATISKPSATTTKRVP